MEQLKLMYVMMAIRDGQGPSENGGTRRVATAEELDAFAEYGWHWPAFKRLLAPFAHVLRGRWRSGSRARTEGSALVSGNASRGA
jgi:hypothetical protein